MSDGSPLPTVEDRPVDGAFPVHADIFFAAVQTTRMPMIVTDPHRPDNPIVFANNAFVKMTGYEAAEVVGRNCRFLQGPETDRNTVAEIRAAVAEERDFATDILNYRKDGSTFWNALFVSPVRNRAGELVYFFSSQLDVSRRRDAETALYQAQKMEALGQLTGGIAHDFNNLLQVISGYADVMEAQAAAEPNLSPRFRRALSAVRAASDKAAKLTHQLLAFSRKQRLEGRLINLNGLVDTMGEMLARTLGDHVAVVPDLAPDLWNVRIDPTQAEVSLLNIFINARDAMPDGGTVSVRTANLVVEDDPGLLGRTPPPGRYVTIEVADTGTGIPAEILSRVTEPFFTTKEEGKGTGLGLAMVHGFAKQSGGTVAIESEPGRGTCVRLVFPAVQDDDVKRDLATVAASERGGDETILVVDDRIEVAETAREFLTDFGYAVHVVQEPRLALALINGGLAADLLITDLAMPGGVDGVMLARAIRERLPAIRVLLTTGFAETERIEAGGGEFDLIHKPFRRLDFVRRVRRILDGPTGVG